MTRLKRQAGITPTHMGKIRNIKAFAFLLWNHPHMHGENSVAVQADVPEKESPPYIMGKVRIDHANNYQY